MSKYFSYFPKTYYSANNKTSSLDTVTNIISRVKFEDTLKQNANAFYKYEIRDGDTPEIIASKIYENPERHWIVLLFNDIVDPQFDWPLDYKAFIDYVDAKYSANGAANTTVQSGLAWAQSDNNIHSYYKVVTTTNADGTFITKKYEVDANTYANVAATSNEYSLQSGETVTRAITKETKTYYNYESEVNEEKRIINLLRPDLVIDVEREFKKVIKGNS